MQRQHGTQAAGRLRAKLLLVWSCAELRPRAAYRHLRGRLVSIPRPFRQADSLCVGRRGQAGRLISELCPFGIFFSDPTS
jgi:hypothetical protein